MYETTRNQFYYFLNVFLENCGTTEKVPFNGKKLVDNQDEVQWLNAERLPKSTSELRLLTSDSIFPQGILITISKHTQTPIIFLVF